MLYAKRHAFTLTELLCSVAITFLLSAILFPVFNRVREQGRRTSCTSNLHQIGLSMIAYSQDWDDRFPCGTVAEPAANLGVGWATQIYVPMKCLSDEGTASYGMNQNLIRTSSNANIFAVVPLAAMSNLTATVLCFEVQNATVALSAVGTGRTLWGGSHCNGPSCTRWATGLLRGVTVAMDSSNNNIADVEPFPAAHFDGSNWLFVDGHVKWLEGQAVSPGWVAASEGVAAVGGCAEGTGLGWTFSWR